MPASRRKAIPVDSLLQLRQRLDHLPKKSPERARQVALVAELYGVSSSTVYRALVLLHRPRQPTAPTRQAPRPAPGGAGALLRTDCGVEAAHHQQAGAASIYTPRH